MISSTAMRVTDLTFSRNRAPVLRGVNTSVSTGALGILGPNGAGKSTLLALMATALKAPKESIFFNETDISTDAGRREARKSTGYQAQTPSFTPSFTVEEAVSYAAWLKETSNSKKAVMEALEAANVLDLAKRKVSKISGGQRKRVSIAQAIVHKPTVVLLDEPTASLDPHERTLLINVLTSLAKTSSVVISTHNARDIAEVCSHVLVVRDGTSVFDGTVDNFVSRVPATSIDRVDAAYTLLMGI